MYQAGDQVVYGIHGVCSVVELEERIIDRKRLSYLVLEPHGQSGSRYLVPTHNEAAMSKLHPMLTKEQMDALLTSEEVHTDAWIREEGQRKQAYRDLVSGGNRAQVMRMLCTLYRHRTSQTSAGKKVHQCDDNFLRDAEKLLSSEISLVMGIEYDQARDYLRRQLKGEV